ncbi:WG repeat-containing protein [Aquiflexum gelatinilyticum]|uniref:WG repeat-containing protein n=1 Tax=Aquiflexum gelatinilyticum TaxID=2961943 RepID=UPI002168CA58|nr:WG repeat-containing protein [Aquiflexum gelatinilyticum]MCS4436812.1 WG repeat-containing protein [Aquiflexum gelatinilyticum]
MNKAFIFLGLLIVSACNSDNPELFKVEIKETGSWVMIFDLVNQDGKTIRTLDTTKYFSIDLNNYDYGHFAIFQLKDRQGFYAINSNEDILFKVFNTTIGEINPDYLVENKIRIIDESGRIGFANQEGEIIIEPQFEMVTAFFQNKAIIGEGCKVVLINTPEEESGDYHYSTNCSRYGYINENGKILEIGAYSFEEIMDKIQWKPPI